MLEGGGMLGFTNNKVLFQKIHSTSTMQYYGAVTQYYRG